MKKLIESLTGGYSSSAKVIDGTLVLSLPDAISPVVWRMDLGQARASALEVRDQKDGTFMLVLKTARGDVNDIAPFAARGQAVRALMAVSRALERAPQGRALPSAVNEPAPAVSPAPPAPRGGWGWGQFMLAGIGVLVLLFILLVVAAPRSATFPPPGGMAGSAAPAADAPGVPVPADSYLNRSQP